MADYRGVAVEKMTALRKQAGSWSSCKGHKEHPCEKSFRGNGLRLFVGCFVRTKHSCFFHRRPRRRRPDFQGICKENEAFQIKALAVGGKLLSADQIDVLAKLPTRDQALALLMSVMNAPN